ncbi:MAG: dTMP kinase [Syntrophales bacterium]|nr:dTMP kinase [Syntrophales bacterium]
MGVFITFEGIEGCGKTTQIRIAEKRLRSLYLPVVRTEEPGGTQLGRLLRRVLLRGAAMAPETELMLFGAARVEHVKNVIMPALAEGKIVLCDRFFDSSLAYQGWGRGIQEETVWLINNLATGTLEPDCTFLLDVEVEVGFSRIALRSMRGKGQQKRDSFEREGVEFHNRVREGYLAQARKNPRRIRVIDARGSIDDVASIVWRELISLLKTRGYVL